MTTNTVEYYRLVRDAVVKYLEENDDLSFTEMVDTFSSSYAKTKNVILTLENGDTVTLDRNTVAQSYEIARLEDPIQFSYFKVNAEDDFIVYDEGYYDSWDGGEWENNVRVGQLKQYTIDYPAEVE